MPQTPLVGTHTYACVSMLLHATIILFPPNSKSCMKTWLGRLLMWAVLEVIYLALLIITGYCVPLV